MSDIKKEIGTGVYLVIDPAMGVGLNIQQLEYLVDEDIAAIQIWDNPTMEAMDAQLLNATIELFKDSKVPILINNRWECLTDFDLDGVHFDSIPNNIDVIKSKVGRRFFKGITLTNDLRKVEMAQSLNFDYVSFCSMFPTATSDSCEIVLPESVKKCREISDMPIFLSGGIKPQNIQDIKALPFEGVAVISGIMRANRPKEELRKYLAELK